jgi:hypothetical protein
MMRKPEVQIAITWRRLLSVVCKLFTFQASSPKPLGQLEPNLAGMFVPWMVLYKVTVFCFEHFPIGSNVNLCIAVAAILDFRSAYKTHNL